MRIDQLIQLLEQEMAQKRDGLCISSELFQALVGVTKKVAPFDWVSWQEGREAVNARDFSKLTQQEHLMLYVALMRNDRFCEGALAAALADGLLLEISTSMQTLEH